MVLQTLHCYGDSRATAFGKYGKYGIFEIVSHGFWKLTRSVRISNGAATGWSKATSMSGVIPPDARAHNLLAYSDSWPPAPALFAFSCFDGVFSTWRVCKTTGRDCGAGKRERVSESGEIVRVRATIYSSCTIIVLFARLFKNSVRFSRRLKFLALSPPSLGFQPAQNEIDGYWRVPAESFGFGSTSVFRSSG